MKKQQKDKKVKKDRREKLRYIREVSAEQRGRILLSCLTGILGGYTTFSSMQLDASKLATAKDRAWAAGYLIVSVVLGLAAAAFGAWLAR